ncbi:tetratricopeptide repeat protein [Streptomyces sp. NPDC046985]|uniref:ATP-binding protein n=1 Tax=Streptomyces sp. NPDC046985 TaxID=3155377 RepID=UPI0033FF0B56
MIEHADHVSLSGGGLKQRRRPLQAPRDIPEFTGRQAIIKRVEESLLSDRGAPAVWVLSGMAGVGKSSIAIRIANAFPNSFPDGILYANLAGASAKPTDTAEILNRFLKDLGVSVGELPSTYESLVTAYRTLIATKAILVVLDDAADTAQVNDLIPTSPLSAALITSRRPLATLPGSQSIPIDVWTVDECIKFLQALLGTSRVESASDEAIKLAEICGRLPIALRIIGAQLTRRPLWPLARMVARLRDEQRRLEVLRADDIAIRSVFATAYESLTPDQARLFRRAGLTLGSTFSIESVATMADEDEYTVEDLLEDLADHYLISSDEVPGRYRLHDLMRLFAKERAYDEEPPEERIASLRRLLEWHLRVLEGDSPSIRTWVRLERRSLVTGVLIAGENGWDEICWRTANELATYNSLDSDYVDWITCNQAGLKAAQNCRSREGQALMAGGLGQASRALDKLNDARSYLEQSLQAFREIDDQYRCAEILWEIGKTASEQWDIAQAISAYTESIEIAKAIKRPAYVARAFHALGHLYSGIGRHDEALAWYEKELQLAAENGASARRRGVAYQGMAACLDASGMAEQSVDSYEKSITLARETDDTRGLRIRLVRKAKVLENLGRVAEANAAYQEALEISREEQNDNAITWATHSLADALARQNEIEKADALYAEALTVAELEDDPEGFISTLHCWGDSYTKRGDFDRAIELLEEAALVARRTEKDQDLIQILLCRSRVEEKRADLPSALLHVQEAVNVARSYGSARILADCLRREGRLLKKLENFRVAADVFDEQLRLEVLMQQWESARNAANELSLIWAELGDVTKAEQFDTIASRYSTKEGTKK